MPYRLKIRAPSFVNLSILGKLLPGHMMADVVASGTAAHTGLPTGTYAKTGTAEYGSGSPPPTDAWLIGFNGDIAFAVLVVDGGYGGPTDGPIAAKFLDALGRAR